VKGVAPDFGDEFAEVGFAVRKGNGDIDELGGRVVASDRVVEPLELGFDPTQFHAFAHAGAYGPSILNTDCCNGVPTVAASVVGCRRKRSNRP